MILYIDIETIDITFTIDIFKRRSTFCIKVLNIYFPRRVLILSILDFKSIDNDNRDNTVRSITIVLWITSMNCIILNNMN